MTDKNTSTELKSAVLNELLSQLRDGTVVVTKEGEPTTTSPSPQLLAQAIAFLKTFPPEDGDPEAEELSRTLKGYKDKLPFAAGRA